MKCSHDGCEKKISIHQHPSLCKEHNNKRLLKYYHRPSSAPSSSSPSSSSFPSRPSSAPLHANVPQPQRWAFITLHSIGTHIKQISFITHHTNKTISKWIKHFNELGNVDDKSRSGRPRKTTEDEDAAIVLMAIDRKTHITPSIIKHELELDVSKRTIDRRLIEGNLYGRVCRKEHLFTAEEIRARLSFCSGYAQMDWCKVLYLDEKTFTLGEHSQVICRRPPGKAFDPDYLADKEPDGDKINVWGCMAASGVGDIFLFNLGPRDESENFNSDLCCEVFNRSLIGSVEDLGLNANNQQWYVLMDNSPIHTSNMVRRWLFNHGITCIDFPAYSPDFNPIENLRHDLSQRVEQHYPRNKNDLKQSILLEWYGTDNNYCQKLINSMPDRMLECVKNKGHITRF